MRAMVSDQTSNPLLPLLNVLTCHLLAKASSLLSMADTSELEKLPPEIRNEIYALVLVQAEPLALCNFGGDQPKIGEGAGRCRCTVMMNNEWARSRKATEVAPVGHKRRHRTIGYQYINRNWVEVPSNVALLCVNQKIHMEAAAVLYSRIKFRFQHSKTMRRFLNLIGDNNQHLRDVGILDGGWEFRHGLYEARYALEALAAANSIQTFEVSHFDICPKRNDPGIHKFVRLCRPLLESLKVAYKNNDLKASVLKVIKFEDADRYESQYCGCTNAQIQRRLEHSIAEQHGLNLES